MSLTVDTSVDPSEDLFGKTIDDLQDGVVVGNSTITGTLRYIDSYPGFSSKPAEQSGNYLVLHCTVPDAPDASISVKVTKPVTLTEDGIIVLRIADKNTQTVTVVASANGESYTKVYDLKGLTVESA